MTTPHPTITTTAPTNVNPTKNTTQVPDIGTGVNNYNKYSLGRTTSAPTVQQKYTFGGLGKHVSKDRILEQSELCWESQMIVTCLENLTPCFIPTNLSFLFTTLVDSALFQY